MSEYCCSCCGAPVYLPKEKRRDEMIEALALMALIKFSWLPSPGPVPVESYKVCVGTAANPCLQFANSQDTEVTMELDINQVWYATVKAVNQYGESAGSNQVVVGKPLPPAALTGNLSQ